VKGVYLLHFEPRYQHAGHYLGSAKDVLARVSDHRAGTSGAVLPEAAARAGVSMMLVRVWRQKGRKFERALKGFRNEKRMGSLARLCPACCALKKVGAL
jgi:predicted GIY-YIG superfamily endonuclease